MDDGRRASYSFNLQTKDLGGLDLLNPELDP
jgi:hypothetical protein